MIHRGLTHNFQSVLVLLVPLQKNQEVLHTKSKSKVMSQFFNDHEIQSPGSKLINCGPEKI